MQAMILLGINCGFGNVDCARLLLTDIKNDWVSFPRPKTGAIRRCPLWPETVKAIEAALAERKTPKDRAHIDFVFITAHSGSFSKDHGLQLSAIHSEI